MDKRFAATLPKVDMRDIYIALAGMEQEPFPAVEVVNGLDLDVVNVPFEGTDDSVICCKPCERWEDIAALIRSVDGQLSDTYTIPKGSPQHCAIPDRFSLYALAAEMSKLLRMPCPQILFRNSDDPLLLGASGRSYAADNMIVLSPAEPLTMYQRMAHEMRHHWQRTVHPRQFPESEYKTLGSVSTNEYKLQKAETDAEAWARRFMTDVFGCEFVQESPEVEAAYSAKTETLFLNRDIVDEIKELFFG